MGIDWKRIKGFQKSEPWGDPDKIKPELIEALVEFRKFIGRSVVIHCGTQGTHVAGSYHGLGMAVDLHVPGMALTDQFIAASRFPAFMGIGLYPRWNNPGLHLDIRPTKIRALWWRDGSGIYQEVNEVSLSLYL